MALNGATPFVAPIPWNKIVIAGNICPGFVRVVGAKASHEWDIKKGKGARGSTITYVQKPPAKFKLIFTAPDHDTMNAWDIFGSVFLYDPTKTKPQAVDVYHPALADVEIFSVVFESVGAWEDAGLKRWERTVECLEYTQVPKASAVGTPNGSAANAANGAGGGPPGVSPTSADDKYTQQLNALIAQAQAP